VCPKRVPPTKGILATRKRIESSRSGGGGQGRGAGEPPADG
jgi:hypothetical protein